MKQGGNNKSLILFTNSFPYGNSETFLVEESKYLFKEFNNVDIFPLYIPDGAELLTCPSNVKVHKPLLPFNHKSKRGFFLHGIFNLAPIKFALKELYKKRVFLSFKKFWIWCNYLLIVRTILGNSKTKKEIIDTIKSNSILYFYWGDKSALITPFIKKENYKPLVVVRFHGSDLYESTKGYLPFRELLYKHIDYAITISNSGANYISSNYKNQPKEIKVFKLGCNNPYSFNPQLNEKRESFNIASCSNIIPLKRVDVIAKALILIERDAAFIEKCKEMGYIKICWTHFGDGLLIKEIKELISSAPKSFIEYNLPGRMPNSNILEYYSKEYQHIFINCSSSEGIPVSIMEALSFGSFIIAPNVGGVTEIVPKENSGFGILTEANISPDNLATIIKRTIVEYNNNIPQLARDWWMANWDSRNNYSSFVNFLSNII